MISEERLKELIEQEKDVWVHAENDVSVGCLHLNKKYQPELYENGLHNYILYVYANDKFEYKEEIFDDELYETKEEAEFVAKYHCSKTIKFEPPTFEEFMNLEIKSIRLNNVGISLGYRRVEVSEYYYNTNDFGFSYFNVENESKESYKQAYYQAVEYAKKLFLGESDE